jgi:hypothetical protein
MRSPKTTLSLWAILFLAALVALFGSAEAQTPAPENQPGVSLATNSASAAIAPPPSVPVTNPQPPTGDGIDPLQQAAEAGDAKSQIKLGQRYLAQGDFTNVAVWYRKAADQGDSEAQCLLGNWYLYTNNTEALKWLRKAADQGNARAEKMLADCYRYGTGVEKNPSEAVKWECKAAEQGTASEQCWLGDSYLTGIGFEKNEVEAVKWYRKAAERGYASAQASLGELYATGEGVKKDHAEAVKWYRKAAEQGDAECQFNLGLCYARGSDVEKDTVEAAKWYRKAADQGYTDAQLQLGIYFMQGSGVIKNDVEGLAWVYLASAGGNERAEKLIPTQEKYYNDASLLEARQRATELQALIAANKASTNNNSASVSQPDAAQNIPKASGSGAFISADGLVLTAAHVVQGATRIEIVMAAGKLDATVVKIDATNDVALLKCTGSNFTPLPIASSKTAREGTSVFTVGFPNIQLQGFDPKLTKGEISSQGGFQDDPRQWQISVPIQPGNSGGPLCDENGNLIGIVLATLDPLKMAKLAGEIPQNVNYAVKSSYILPLLDDVQNLPPPLVSANGTKFEDVVGNVQKSVVLILVY